MGACVRVRDGWGDRESPGLAGATCAGGDFLSLALTYGLHQRREVGLLGTGEGVRGCFSAFGRAELDIRFAVFLLGGGSSERQRTLRGGTEAERPQTAAGPSEAAGEEGASSCLRGRRRL